MDRRESLKSMVLGSLAIGATLNSCIETTDPKIIEDKIWKYTYGRTSEEAIFDEKLLGEQFFEENELKSIKLLANLILPPNENGTIEDAGVVEFIEFMVKDVPEFQIKIRGGLMWLNGYCNSNYSKLFVNCSKDQQRETLDSIAFPNPNVKVQVQEVRFFSLMRNLVLTGYFTSEVGIKELGYKGNTPNVWDGVPQDVLDKHGLSYDSEWLSKCIDQSTRGDIAQWDDEGNLIS